MLTNKRAKKAKTKENGRPISQTHKTKKKKRKKWDQERSPENIREQSREKRFMVIARQLAENGSQNNAENGPQEKLITVPKMNEICPEKEIKPPTGFL